MALAGVVATSAPMQAEAQTQGLHSSFQLTQRQFDELPYFKQDLEELGQFGRGGSDVFADQAIINEFAAHMRRQGSELDITNFGAFIRDAIARMDARVEDPRQAITRWDRYDLRAEALDPIFANLAETMPRQGNGNLTPHGHFVNAIIKEPRIHQFLDAIVPGSVGEYAREFAMQFQSPSLGALHYQFNLRIVEMMREQGIEIPTAPGAGGQLGNLVQLPTFTGNAEFTGNEWLLQLAIWMQEHGQLEGEIWQGDDDLAQLPTGPGNENTGQSTGGGNIIDLPTGGPSQGIDLD